MLTVIGRQSLLLLSALLALSLAHPHNAGHGAGSRPSSSHHVLGSGGIPTDGPLTEVFRWKQLEYDQLLGNAADSIAFVDEDELENTKKTEQRSALNADYVAYNNVPMGVTHYRDRLFITVPRRRPGIPATLNYVSVKASPLSSPTLRAYPSYELNELPRAGATQPHIVSVYRLRVDGCNRLWFVDTGALEYPNNIQQIQQPSIWIIDLETDRVVRRFEIPSTIVQRGQGLASVTVDVQPGRCDEAFAYLPDLLNNCMFTYDFRRNRIWQINHNYFHFDPTQGHFDVAGQRFQWDDGVFSVTLGNRNAATGDRAAYFHPMVSTHEFAIRTRHLQSETEAGNIAEQFQDLGTRGRSTQSAMHDFDPRLNTIFFSQVATNGLSCWNVKAPLNGREGAANNHVQLQRNNQTMVYPSDLNIDDEGTLWIMTNTMPVFIYSRLDPNVYNFRVWKAKTADLVRGTACET